MSLYIKDLSKLFTLQPYIFTKLKVTAYMDSTSRNTMSASVVLTDLDSIRYNYKNDTLFFYDKEGIIIDAVTFNLNNLLNMELI